MENNEDMVFLRWRAVIKQLLGGHAPSDEQLRETYIQAKEEAGGIVESIEALTTTNKDTPKPTTDSMKCQQCGNVWHGNVTSARCKCGSFVITRESDDVDIHEDHHKEKKDE